VTGLAPTFWWALTWACVAWYSALTLYVAWKGLRDIRRMLRDLQARHDAARR
jgi:hypothetical protein